MWKEDMGIDAKIFEEYDCLVGPHCTLWNASCLMEDGPVDAGFLIGRTCQHVFRNKDATCPECPISLEAPSFFYARVLREENGFKCTARPLVDNSARRIPLETRFFPFISIGICATNHLWNPVFWNLEWCRITGWNGCPQTFPSWIKTAGAGVIRNGTVSLAPFKNDAANLDCLPGDYRWLLAWEEENGSGAECSVVKKKTATHDILTGLHDRESFDEILLKADESSEMVPMSLLVLGVDDLQSINDVLGTDRKDAVPDRMANVLRNACRAEEAIARIEDDELRILLPFADPGRLEEISARFATTSARLMRDVPYGFSTGWASGTANAQAMHEARRVAEGRMRGRSMHTALLRTIEAMMAETSRETKGHAERLRSLCSSFGEALRLDDSSMELLDLVARLHDIGKIAVPLEILRKTDPLSEDDWRVIRRHPDVGFRIVSASSPNIAAAADGVRCHHERWDGRGYPGGCSGPAIPLFARIVSIADAYDVMRNERPYKHPASSEQARSELIRCSGTQFDPTLVPVFLDVLDSIGR